MPFAATAAVLAVLSISACQSDSNSIAAEAKSGNRSGYTSQDGTVSKLPVTDRKAPLTVSGTTLTGTPWRVADQRGSVVVLNVWGSWCPPCVAESADLEKAWKQLKAAGPGPKVQFMGIDIRESSANGSAFVRSQGITYPSLTDEGSQAVLALQGAAPSPPTTIVLDPQGRIAARVLGQVSTSTLTGLVHDVRAESTPA